MAASDKLGKTNTSLQAASFRLLKVSASLAQAALRDPSGSEEVTGLVRKAALSVKQLSEAIARQRG